MGHPILKPDKKYTYADYLQWDDNERWEIIDGEVYNMSPAPLRLHQQISFELSRQIGNCLADKSCEAYAAPFDVRIAAKDESDEETATVVQPDISIICDSAKLDEKGCKGAPDFIAEIISPSTAAKDQIQKTNLYETSGVREYWIIHPTDNLVTIRLLDENGRYGFPVIIEGKGKRRLTVLPELEIDLDALYGSPS